MSNKINLVIFGVVLLGAIGYGGYLTYKYYHPGPNPTASNPAGLNTIDINDNGFSPKNYTIRSGTGMTWVNRGVKDHEVVFDSGFDSGKMAPQDVWHYMFVDKDTYKYHCKIHPNEKGSITVQ